MGLIVGFNDLLINIFDKKHWLLISSSSQKILCKLFQDFLLETKTTSARYRKFDVTKKYCSVFYFK